MNERYYDRFNSLVDHRTKFQLIFNNIYCLLVRDCECYDIRLNERVPFRKLLESCLLAKTENLRCRVRTIHGMDEHQLGTHFMPEYFLNTIDVMHFNSSIRFGLV